MASNLSTGGFGRSLSTGGFGGSGLATGSAALIQNPSYETPGTDVGEAVNWTASIVSTASEYATFDHPGSNIITDQIPAEQPVLGYSISHQLDGTLIISQATDADSAQEDFEQGWQGNEGFVLVFLDAANDPANFDGKSIDDFESGWGNDSGELIDIDSISHGFAVFNTQPVEHFDVGWPTASNGVLLDAIPNVVFGQWNDGTSTFTPGDSITTPNQYADSIFVRLLSDMTQLTIFVIHILDKADNPIDVIVDIETPLKTGATFGLPFTTMFGVRAVTGITVGPGVPGIYSIEGDPGQRRDEHNNLIAHWERAVFG